MAPFVAFAFQSGILGLAYEVLRRRQKEHRYKKATPGLSASEGLRNRESKEFVRCVVSTKSTHNRFYFGLSRFTPPEPIAFPCEGRSATGAVLHNGREAGLGRREPPNFCRNIKRRNLFPKLVLDPGQLVEDRIELSFFFAVQAFEQGGFVALGQRHDAAVNRLAFARQ